MSRTRRLRVAGALGALMVLVLPTSSHADTQRFRDAHDDVSSSVDIWWVKVDNSTTDRSKVVVVVQQDTVRLGDSITIFYDTRPEDRGPEFRLSAFVASEYGMSRVESWNSAGHFISTRCGYSLKIHQGTDRSHAVVPRHCLGSPGRIRVAVQVERASPASTTDWAKARRTWLDWVRR